MWIFRYPNTFVEETVFSHCVFLALSYRGCLPSFRAFHLRVTKRCVCSVKARPCRNGQNFLEQPLLEIYPDNKVTRRKIYAALPWWLSAKEPACPCKRRGFGPGRSPEEGMAPPSSILAWKSSHGQRSLVDYSPWGCEESDTTEVTEQQQRL